MPKDVEICAEVDGKPVVKINNGAFECCDSLESIIIPGSVAEIGRAAFACCNALKSVELSTGITKIGFGSFERCVSLADIMIPDGVTEIKGGAFLDCESLRNITLPNCVQNIGFNAFYNTAYSNDEANWEDGALYIGAFLIDTNLSIGESYAVKEGTKVIAEWAFVRGDCLINLTIPSSVINIGVFRKSEFLDSIVVDEDNKVYDSRDNCNAVIKTATNELIIGCKNTIIPETVESIGNWAFADCSSLKSVTIPDNVTNIGYFVFFRCSSLEEVTLPSKLEAMKEGAFHFNDPVSVPKVKFKGASSVFVKKFASAFAAICDGFAMSFTVECSDRTITVCNGKVSRLVTM